MKDTLTDEQKRLFEGLVGVDYADPSFEERVASLPETVEEFNARIQDCPGLKGDFSAEAKVLWAYVRRIRSPSPPPTTSHPKHSLQGLAKELGKSSRQIRRYCEEGLVPGAVRTKGGHWRVPCDPETIENIRRSVEGKVRQRGKILIFREWLNTQCSPGDIAPEEIDLGPIGERMFKRLWERVKTEAEAQIRQCGLEGKLTDPQMLRFAILASRFARAETPEPDKRRRLRVGRLIHEDGLLGRLGAGVRSGLTTAGLELGRRFEELGATFLKERTRLAHAVSKMSPRRWRLYCEAANSMLRREGRSSRSRIAKEALVSRSTAYRIMKTAGMTELLHSIMHEDLHRGQSFSEAHPRRRRVTRRGPPREDL